jgi:putative aldouronate transport system permease protein
MLLVPASFVIMFHYAIYPNLRMAFMNFRPVAGWAGSDWVGFGTFERVFRDAEFFLALRNTVFFNILDIILQFPAPIILALMLNELRLRRFKRVSQTILYMPHFLSAVIVASVAYELFRTTTGIVNVLMVDAGWIERGIPFLTDPWHWIFTYLTINIWQAVGWGSIIYLAAITGIDPALYEAAAVDGAGRWKRMWHVTLPGMKPTIVILFIMRLGHLLGSGFDRLWAFGNVNVRSLQYQLSIYIYERGLLGGNFSRATAVGLFQALVAVMLVIMADRIVKLLGEDGLL